MLITIGLGSNLEPRSQYLLMAAVAIVKRIGPVAMASALYESEPWGFQAHTPFINQVLRIQSPMPPQLILQNLLIIESQLGRTRHASGYASRTIDLDLLLCGALSIWQPGLLVPHPRMHLRRFVLEPLAEIDPMGLHPLLGKTWAELLAQCDDPCWVKRIEYPPS